MILLDAQMPDMDGFETARILSAAESTIGIPIVMVTSLSGLANRLLALKAGAADLLSKPVEPAELRAKIASLANLKRYNDEMKRRHAELRLSLAGARNSSKPRWTPTPVSCPRSSCAGWARRASWT